MSLCCGIEARIESVTPLDKPRHREFSQLHKSVQFDFFVVEQKRFEGSQWSVFYQLYTLQFPNHGEEYQNLHLR